MAERTFLEIWEERQKGRGDEPHKYQTREIIQALEALGVRREDINTNDYRFTLQYGGAMVEFFNHGVSLAGTIHKKPSGDLERACLEDADDILNTPQYSAAERQKFVEEFGYRKFNISGEPAKAVADIIKLAQTTIAVVERRGYTPIDASHPRTG